MKKLSVILILSLTSILLFAQNPSKKTMDHDVYAIWNKINNTQISPDGNWVTYSITPGEGDATLHVYNAATQKDRTIARGVDAKISEDNQFVIFKIKPYADSLKQMRRRKVKDDELPKDTLGIMNLQNGKVTRIPNLKSFKLPEKWSGFVAYQIEKGVEIKDEAMTIEIDTTTQAVAVKPSKKQGKDNGNHLIIRDLSAAKEDTVFYVTDYSLAKEKERIILTSTGRDSTFMAGVYWYDCEKLALQHLYRGKGEFKNLTFDKEGKQASFVADIDTSNQQVSPYGLYYWNGRDTADLIMKRNFRFMSRGWLVSEYYKPNFADDGSKLFFGINPEPILQDTTLLPEEIVNVEVWSYTDKRLHTQQKVRLKDDKEKSYLCVYNTKGKNFAKLAEEDLPTVRPNHNKNSKEFITYTEEPYLETMSWEGFPTYKDIFWVNAETGAKRKIAQKIKANPNISIQGKYAYWYSHPDTAWYAVGQSGRVMNISAKIDVPLYDELNDRPMHPSPYGTAAWMEDDAAVLIYDRYDIWRVDPNGSQAPQRLTKGRETKTVYRFVPIDFEDRFIPKNSTILLHSFKEADASSGYAKLDLRSGDLRQIMSSEHSYTRRITKAKNADKLIFHKSSFQEFPNLQYTNLAFENPTTISDANPQQDEYSWGTIEHYEWTSLDGQLLKGLLVKPENFDPNKKYPMIVNFYERSSHRLHSHRMPAPHRSTINYSFYANRGYVIFNPDVPYRVGYPGESAYNAVISGVTALIAEGFVDEENIGTQGHSWGGYQVAHLITKTNIFKCAESGAPVVNMFSAYGGIRWRSGLSRMFQYEHTQSRIGGTIWEMPLRYMENSPIFFADKIETPVLIMHNDKDGAVPWYQGIEFFVAMRRLNKPAWLLNYNDEPHWPVKLQNRIDFNIRMQQFFDHYLKGEDKPQWMERGVPAIEKGIRQGY